MFHGGITCQFSSYLFNVFPSSLSHTIVYFPAAVPWMHTRSGDAPSRPPSPTPWARRGVKTEKISQVSHARLQSDREQAGRENFRALGSHSNASTAFTQLYWVVQSATWCSGKCFSSIPIIKTNLHKSCGFCMGWSVGSLRDLNRQKGIQIYLLTSVLCGWLTLNHRCYQEGRAMKPK